MNHSGWGGNWQCEYHRTVPIAGNVFHDSVVKRPDDVISYVIDNSLSVNPGP